MPSKAKSGGREWLWPLADKTRGHHPTAVEFRGDRWDAVSDGHALLTVRGATLLRDNFSATYEGALELYADAELASAELETSHETLLEWARAAGPAVELCTECQGGTVDEFECTECNGAAKKTCHSCGNTAECRCCVRGKIATCPGCKGRKELERPMQPGELLGVYFDRLRLRRFLEHLTPGPVLVRVQGERDPMRFEGDGWLLILMGIDVDLEPADRERAVRFLEAA